MQSMLRGQLRTMTGRVLVALLLSLVVLAISVASALACDITIQPSTTTLQTGEPQTVTVKVHLTHKNCETPIDETAISTQGLQILSETPWQGGGQDYQKQLTVVASQPGQASLSVVRECSKGGDSTQMSFQVVEGATESALSAATPATVPQAPAPMAPGGQLEPTVPPQNSGSTGNSLTVEPSAPSAATSSTKDGRGRGRGRSSTGLSATNSPVQKPATATTSPTPPPTPPATATALPNPVAAASIDPAQPPTGSSNGSSGNSSQKTSSKSTDLSSLLIKALQEPKTVAIALLLAISAVGFLRGYHWLRKPVLLASLGYIGFYLGGCLCPLGAIQNLALPETTLNQKTGFFVTLGVPLLATLIFGRLYCGWICPAGALQELVHFAKIARPVPPAWDRWLKLLKYPLFVGLIAAVRIAGEPIFEGYDPFKVAWERGGEVYLVVALAFILGLSVFIYRPWCRYICPMGAVFAVVSRFSLLRLAPSSSCVACRLCVKACGSQSITCNREKRTVTVDTGECISCGSCLHACRKSALRVSRMALPVPVQSASPR